MIKTLSVDLLSYICEYLDIPSLWGFYKTFHKSRDSLLICALGSSLRCLHAGYLCHDSDGIYMNNYLDDKKIRNGFPLWLLSAPKRLRSIKLVLATTESFCRVIYSIMEIFTSGRCQDLESIVIITGQLSSLSCHMMCSAIAVLMRSISDACKMGYLMKLKEFDITNDDVRSRKRVIKDLITSLINFCPVLQSIGSMDTCPELFEKKLDANCDEKTTEFFGSVANWRSVTSLDISDLIATIRARGGNLEEASEHLINNLSSGIFPKLKKLLFRYQASQLNIGEDSDCLLVFITACFDYFALCDRAFFGSQILVFEIDCVELDPHDHFRNSQDWADLAKRFTPTTTYSSAYASHMRRGIFPNLEILRCNHWLPCSQLLRMFRGNIPWKTIQPTGVPGGAAQNQHVCNKKIGMKLELKLEVSPGTEDPCFSSFLTNLWDPNIQPIWCMLIRRRRRLVHGTERHFCDYDLGYRTNKKLTSNQNPLYYDNLHECYDERPELLDFDQNNIDKYSIDYNSPLKNLSSISFFSEQQVVCTAILKAIQDQKFYGIKVLGLCEDFFRFIGCYKKNIDGKQLRSIISIFRNCSNLNTLYIYLESELMVPLTVFRVKETAIAIIVILSCLNSIVVVEKEEIFTGKNENENENENENVNEEEELIYEDKPLIKTIFIDFPSIIFYKFVRHELLDHLVPLSVLNCDNMTENNLDNHSKISIIVKLKHLSQESSFLWNGDPSGYLLQKVQTNLTDLSSTLVR